MKKVFVYGTLKKGNRNNTLLSKEKLLSSFVITAKPFLMLEGAFPLILEQSHVYSKPFLPIKGELYTLSEETLKSLDYLEGFPDFYQRQELAVVNPYTGNMYDECVCYYYTPSREWSSFEERLQWVSPVYDTYTNVEYYEWNER